MFDERRDTSFTCKFCQIPLCKKKMFYQIFYHAKEKYYKILNDIVKLVIIFSFINIFHTSSC